MREILRIVSKDIRELTLSKNVLLFLLIAPLALLFLFGRIQTRAPIVSIALIQDHESSSSTVDVRTILRDCTDLAVYEPPEPPTNIAAWLAEHSLDAALVTNDKLSMIVASANPYKQQRLIYLREEIQLAILLSDTDAPAYPPSLVEVAFPKDILFLRSSPVGSHRIWIPALTGLFAVFLPFLLASGGLAREQECGMLAPMVAAVRNRWTWLVLGKMGAPLILGMTIFFLTLVFSRTLFDIEAKSGFVAIAGFVLIAATTSAFSGLSVSTVLRTQQQAYVVSAVYLLGLILLSNAFFKMGDANLLVRVTSWIFPLTLLEQPLDAWYLNGTDPMRFAQQLSGLGIQCGLSGLLAWVCMSRARRSS